MHSVFKVITFLFAFSMVSQNVNIPDANFKNYLLTNTDVNTNNDAQIQVSEAEATTSLSFQFWQVADVTGIEAFTNLTFLDCGDNNLTSLDLSQNVALQQLYCYDNQLTSLDVSANENLIALDCRDNQIALLDLSSNPLLYYLQCPFNGMTSLNVANTAMQTLRAYSNAITNLNITNTEATLETLLVYNNNISELDLSSYTALTIFECQNSSMLSNLNIANANNTNISTFRALNTPNLECIQVDNAAYSTTNWINVDAETAFSENCSLSIKAFNAVLSIYPNPVTNYLYLELLENVDYNIISLQGKMVKSGKLLARNNSLDVSQMTQNIYIIQLKTRSGKTFSSKFVKN